MLAAYEPADDAGATRSQPILLNDDVSATVCTAIRLLHHPEAFRKKELAGEKLEAIPIGATLRRRNFSKVEGCHVRPSRTSRPRNHVWRASKYRRRS
jgi:hypothetical protein